MRTNGAGPVSGPSLLRATGWLAALSGAAVLLAACNGTTSDKQASESTHHTASSNTPSASDSSTPTVTPSETPTDTPSTAAQSTGPAITTDGVYFVVDTRSGPRLARELTDLHGGDPSAAAVTAMIAGPTDADYATTWNPRTQVHEVTRSGNVITVDLSSDARTADVGAPGAEAMVQQLVYTVTEAMGAPKAGVRLLIDGKQPGKLWGAVDWTKPVHRKPDLQERMLVQIDTPREGTTTTSPLQVHGVAAANEANVPWQVLDAHGKVVRKGATMAAAAMQFSPYSFQVPLKPGKYTVEVSEDDPSGGEGGPAMKDTRTVTIRK